MYAFIRACVCVCALIEEDKKKKKKLLEKKNSFVIDVVVSCKQASARAHTKH